MLSLYLKRQNTILSILEKEKLAGAEETIYIILWVVPMKDWVIRKMPNFILERLRSVQPNLRLHSSITTNNLTRYIIKDLLGVSWVTKKARSRFNKLINHGEQHLFDHVKIDYFAVSLPDLLIWEDDLNLRNQIHCNLVMGLGYLGLNDRKTAERFLGKVREARYQPSRIECAVKETDS